jgi:hypothetical protein
LFPLPSFLFFFPASFGISLSRFGLLRRFTALWLCALWLSLTRLRPLLLRLDNLTGLRLGRLWLRSGLLRLGFTGLRLRLPRLGLTGLRLLLLRLGYLSTARICLGFWLDRLSRLL